MMCFKFRGNYLLVVFTMTKYGRSELVWDTVYCSIIIDLLLRFSINSQTFPCLRDWIRWFCLFDVEGRGDVFLIFTHFYAVPSNFDAVSISKETMYLFIFVSVYTYYSTKVLSVSKILFYVSTEIRKT